MIVTSRKNPRDISRGIIHGFREFISERLAGNMNDVQEKDFEKKHDLIHIIFDDGSFR
jgi:hypothetical protein